MQTVPVKQAHRFDENRLGSYLAEHMQGFTGPLAVRQFEGGQSNPTFLLETPGASYVMRRKPPGILVKSAHAVDREFRIISALAGTGVPVPRAHLLCEDTAVAGTEFFVMDYIPGRVFPDPKLPDLAPQERRALIFDYVDTLARLHAVDTNAVGLHDFGRPGNYFARQISRWGRQFQDTETEHVQEMHTLLAWLERSVPEQSAVSIVHGDFQFGNCLIDAREPRIAAVLDWELSTTGDPLADFTYFTSPWHAREGERSYAGQDLDKLGIPAYAEVAAHYCERTGRAGIPHEAFYRAFHAFRSAAILQGIIRRAMQGNNAGEMALQFSPADVRAGAIHGLSYI